MPDILTVSNFTQLARETIEDVFGDVQVEGEISNFKQHTSGHCYFTLKDKEAQVKCVMWRHTMQSLYFKPENGMQVRLYGKASVYEKRGDLQLVARALRHAGEGGLQKAFEELKQKLYQEGLFDTELKKPFPTFPKRIGVVTSETGAALHDILSIIERRYPIVEVLLFPVQVQGVHAAPTIAAAIERANQLVTEAEFRVELLIVGRGGGSLEDLWAFNEEEVARAIFASAIPVMSAVGHETDFTIADYVADKRAATPSMAAELATPSAPELYGYIQGLSNRSRELMLTCIEEHRRDIQAILSKHSFNRPVDQLAQYRQHVDMLASRLSRLGPRYVEGLKERVEGLNQRLALLDPYRPLKKGYVIVEQDGQFVRSAEELVSDTPASLRFEDGIRTVKATD